MRIAGHRERKIANDNRDADGLDGSTSIGVWQPFYVTATAVSVYIKNIVVISATCR